MKTSFKITLLVFAASFLLSVNSKSGVVGARVASVNGKPISSKKFNDALSPIMAQYIQRMPQIKTNKKAQQEIRKRLLEQMIDRELILQAAAGKIQVKSGKSKKKKSKEKIEPTEAEINQAISRIKQNFARATAKDGKPLAGKKLEKAFHTELKKQGLTYKQFRQQIIEELTVNKYIQKEVFSKVIPPKEKETKKLFDDTMKVAKGDKKPIEKLKPQEMRSHLMLAQNFKAEMSAKVRVSHILFKTDPGANKKELETIRKKAMNVLKKAKQKEKDSDFFAELARTHSDDKQSVQRGGDIGFIIKGMLPKEFEDAAFALKPGKIAPRPVKTPYGYHIIRVTAEEEAKPLKFEQAKEELAKFLIVKKRQAKLDEILTGLKNNSTIKISKPKQKVKKKSVKKTDKQNKKDETEKTAEKK